jgi:endoglucanase
VVVVYHIPNLDCAGPSAGGAADADAYARFIERTVEVLGNSGAAIVLEPDAVAAECFDEARAAMLTDATRELAAAGHHVFLDAGHPRWRGPAETAERLRRSGITRAEGFSVNVSNRQSTRDSHRWGWRCRGWSGPGDGHRHPRNGLPAPPV